MRGFVAIFLRDLLSLVVTPLGYVVAASFLLLQGWDFALLLAVLNDPLAAPGPVMQFYFGGSFFIFWLPVIFTCGVLSMGAVADERRAGTLELVFTTRVSPAAFILGKYAARLAFYISIWLPTGVFFVLLRGAAVRPDPGPVLLSYLATFAIGAMFLAVGVAWSTLVRHPLGAALATLVTCTVALMAGLLADHTQNPILAGALERTSLLGFMEDASQGIGDDGQFLLMFAVTAGALALSVVAVNPRRKRVHWLRLALAVGIGAVWTSAAVPHTVRRDFTAGQIYSLSARAREILVSLPQRVSVHVIVPQALGAGRTNPVARELKEVLTRMASQSENLAVTFLDPDLARERAAALVSAHALAPQQLADGVVLVESGQGSSLRRKALFPDDLVVLATGEDVQVSGPRVASFRGEEALMAAFIAVTRERLARVCVSAGLGEPDLRSLEPFAGAAHFRRLLEDAPAQVLPLSAAMELSGCDVAVFVGTATPLSASAREALRGHLAAGGDAMILSGALIRRGETALARTGLDEVLADYGIELGTRLVLGEVAVPGSAPGLAFTVVDGLADHPATRAVLGRSVSLVLAREVRAREAPGVSAEVVLRSDVDARAVTDLQALLQGAPPSADADDPRGPFDLAVAASKGDSRVLVVGSDQLALNAYLRPDIAYDANRDVLQNGLAWVLGDDALAGVRPRPREHVKLVLREDTLARMSLVATFGPPALVFGIFVLVMMRRRATGREA